MAPLITKSVTEECDSYPNLTLFVITDEHHLSKVGLETVKHRKVVSYFDLTRLIKYNGLHGYDTGATTKQRMGQHTQGANYDPRVEHHPAHRNGPTDEQVGSYKAMLQSLIEVFMPTI